MVGAIDSMTDTFVFEISHIVFDAIFILIVVGLQNIYFSAIFLAWIIIFIFVQYRLYKRNYPYEIKANERDSKVSGALSDTITNNFNIKTFASAEREYGFFDGIVTAWKNINRTRWMRAMVIRASTGFMMVGLEFGIFYYAIRLRNHDLLTIGMFVLLQMYIMRLFDQLWSIGNIFRHMYRAFSESAEMLEILDEPHEVQDHSHHKLNVESGRIEFVDIRFTYDSKTDIFDGLDLRIKPGEKIAIIGESGSGKTTLVKLLFRFFDIQ